MAFTTYALPSMAAVTILLFLLFYVFFYRRHGAGAWLVLLILAGSVIWSFGYSMVLLNTQFDQKVFWFNLSQLGPDFTPILWFFLALEHTGRQNLLRKKWLYTVFIFPVFTTVLMWTNNWHHLLRRSVTLGSIGNQPIYLAIERGPWFYYESIYGYVFVLLTLYLLIRFVNVSSSKKQALAVIYSILIPILSNLLDIFQVNPLKPFGATSIALSITGIVLAWGLFRQQFLDIAPIARTVVLEKIGDGVVVLDKNHRIVDANPAAYPLFRAEGNSPSRVIGAEIEDMISLWPEWKEPFVIINDVRVDTELKVNGAHRFYNVTSSLMTDHRLGPMGWVIIFHDITEARQANQRLQNQLDEIKQLQEQLHEQAIHDALTGCYNRYYLTEMLVRETSRANRENQTIGLMMLDIDYFKNVNDKYGHVSGDLVLQIVGKSLQQWVRVADTVYRYGGEEFLTVLPGISLKAITDRANRIRSQISELQIAVTQEETIMVTVSIGVALYPVHGDDIYQVLKCADQSLYDAKHAGRNTVIIWNAATAANPSK